MTVTEDFSRVENTYQMEAEVCIQPNQKIKQNSKKCVKDLQKFTDCLFSDQGAYWQHSPKKNYLRTAVYSRVQLQSSVVCRACFLLR